MPTAGVQSALSLSSWVCAVITCKSACSGPRCPPGTVDAVFVGPDPLEMTLEANELPKMVRNTQQEYMNNYKKVKNDSIIAKM